MKVRTEQDWHKVYDVLVQQAGAPQSMRPHFVQDCSGDGLTEWRFEGYLGFGGKIWLRPHSGELYVTCYTGDSNTVTRAIMTRVNDLLKKL